MIPDARSHTRSEVEAILGAEIEDEQLILTRRISSQGKGHAHANGMPVSVGTLRALGARLIMEGHEPSGLDVGADSSAAAHVGEDGSVTVISGNPDIGGSRASTTRSTSSRLAGRFASN